MSVTVKICGLTNLEDARVAIEAGADLLGFILYSRSPRYVAPNDVAKILKDLRQHVSARGPVRTIGVFVNESVDHIQSVLDMTGLHMAQLHGDEPVEYVEQLSGRAFKALRPTEIDAAYTSAQTYSQSQPHARPSLLVDAYDAAAYGGTGRHADWVIAARIASSFPGLLLSGGLDPDNVAQAINVVQPWGVDVSSGVEASPGRKDPSAVRHFVANAKASSPSTDRLL